ncbi:MAG: hypothetical protein AAGU12_13975 [Clostridiales bacterium]
MEELFNNNIFIIFIMVSVAIISYSNFLENQRMFLLYLFSYGTAYFNIFNIRESLALLLITTFIFLEYLTDDAKKLELIVRFDYKILDFVFLIFFQYQLLMIIFSFLFLWLTKQTDTAAAKYLLYFLSFSFLIYGEHQVISQPFKVKNITNTIPIFEKFPVYTFQYEESMQEKFDLLCAVEDKSYFYRTKSYSSYSMEYLQYLFTRHDWRKLSLRKVLRRLPAIKFEATGIRVVGRGFSTPEMQLLRTIGIARGYDRHKIKRKIYEIVYSKILFTSLKSYHQANSYLSLKYYRHYLLFVYFQAVLTKIKGKRYMPLSTTFSDPKGVQNWSLNGLFIACLGLSFKEVSDHTLMLHDDIIQQFKLNPQCIRQLNAGFPETKF